MAPSNALNCLRVAGVIAFAIALAACGQPPKTIVVEMKQLAFVPARVQARPGDTIVFKNLDFVPHTATARDSAWDSGTIEANKEWRLVVKDSASYFCFFHPTMTGVIAKQ